MLHLFTSLTLLTLPLVLADPLVTTTATTPLPTQGQPCTSGNAFCVAGPIIARCDTGVIGYGNCADNLGEPPLGATCISFAASSASCSAYMSTVSPSASTSNATVTATVTKSKTATLTLTGTGTGTGGGRPTSSANGTGILPTHTPTKPSSSVAPIATGAAAEVFKAGVAMIGGIAAVVGGVIVL